MERFVGAVSLTAMMWCLASIAPESVSTSDVIDVRPSWMSTALEIFQRPQSATQNSATQNSATQDFSIASNTSPNPSSLNQPVPRQVPARSMTQEVVLSRTTLSRATLSRATLASILVHKLQLRQKSQQAQPQLSQGLQVLTQLVTSIVTSENLTSASIPPENLTENPTTPDHTSQHTSKNYTSQDHTSKTITPKNVTLKDVAPSHWAYADIQTVLRLGIMSVQRQGQFLPNQRVTRAEAFSSIAQVSSMTQDKRGSQFSDRTVQQILDRYPDATTVPTWARRSMATALRKGFVNLRQGDRIDPLSPMTASDLAHALTVYRQQQNYFSHLDITRSGVVD